jgi:hypothetical protein
MLEELKAIGAITGYEPKSISFAKNEQKEPWFLAVNPNGAMSGTSTERQTVKLTGWTEQEGFPP